MKMLIEKQAAAAARLNSPSRLEAFAADSPPRRRRHPGTPTKASGGADRGGGSRHGGRDAIMSPPSPRRTASAGGIALSELVSATTPPRSRSSALKVDAGGGGVGERRTLAQETYTTTFTGMQVLCLLRNGQVRVRSSLTYAVPCGRKLGNVKTRRKNYYRVRQ